MPHVNGCNLRADMLHEGGVGHVFEPFCLRAKLCIAPELYRADNMFLNLGYEPWEDWEDKPWLSKYFWKVYMKDTTSDEKFGVWMCAFRNIFETHEILMIESVGAIGLLEFPAFSLYCKT